MERVYVGVVIVVVMVIAVTQVASALRAGLEEASNSLSVVIIERR